MGIITTLKEEVCFLKLNRPEVFNSFNKDMAFSIQKELDACANNDAIRAIVIMGEGKAFCAGQDLVEATDPNGPDMNSIVKYHYNPIIKKIRNIEKPIIAAVNGVAAGAGANIALSCDIVIASEKASFIQAFSKIGLIPDSGGTFFLPRLIGFQKASALMITGDKIPAKEAEEMNLIYKCIADEEFHNYIAEFAKKIGKMPTKGIGLTKRLLNKSMTNNLNDQLDLEEKLQTEAGATEDFNEGVKAFKEKRKPTFKGK